MFIKNYTKTLFEVMYDFDNSTDPETRAKELRHGVMYYNAYSGMGHELTHDLLKLYWIFLDAPKP